MTHLDHNDDEASLESAIMYPMYFRRHGVRRAVQLVAPTLSPLQKLDLPRASILHYVADDESQTGIPQDDFILRNAERLVQVEHITQLGDTKGNPRPTRLPAGGMVREYHRRNRKTRPVTARRDLALKDPRTLLVINYAMLPHLYQYTTSLFRSYYKWWNIQSAVWSTVGMLSREHGNDHQQYMICSLPKRMPTLAQLMKGQAALTRTTLAAFADPNALFLLEVWKWLGVNRAESVLSKSAPKDLANMNLIWTGRGEWFVTNLGLLDSWRKPTEEEIAAGAVVGRNQIEPDKLQRRFLRMTMFLREDEKLPGEEKAPPVEPVSPSETDSDVAVVKGGVAEERPLKISVQGEGGKTQNINLKVNLNIDKLPHEATEETPENNRIIDEAITKDLEALDHLAEQFDHLANDTSDVAGQESPVAEDRELGMLRYEPEARSLETGVMNKVDQLADVGAVTAPEYRRFQKQAAAYKTLPNPFGKDGTLEDAITIDPELLKVQVPHQIPDIDTVFDKSMLHSSLFDFDQQYIEKVLHKDVARMVLHIQHGGVAVTGYQMVDMLDAVTHAERHMLKLEPVEGKPSSIQFTLPKVKPDGTYKANGVHYFMRKQRGDVPIRKISPSKVALTSYYPSRLMVARSEKQVNNYVGWLTNQIATRAMDADDASVTNAMLSNVFKRTNRTPRMYSILASRFRSFTSGDIDFFFDYGARAKHFGLEMVQAAESEGIVLIGNRKGVPVVIDTNDAFYTVQDDTLTPIGKIENLLSLSPKSPMEVIEVGVFGASVPVGLFLAYHLGLSKLLEVLNVRPRRVPTGERPMLNDDEFMLRFEDEVLIVSRDNRMAASVLSGIANMEKITRNYAVHLFDRKDIYYNVLEQTRISPRYLREMDMLYDLFVDPITAEILQEMGEPTDFIQLVLRACELLQTDWSPDETDMAYMRIKGYERMAGAVYSELIKAIRTQRSRGSVARAIIDIPPYAVWNAIQQDDPAVKLVESTNPVHNLKEKEEVTYSGTGGRSGRSMVQSTRVFHPNDMGVISEATKDSADVAITTFLTADPQLVSLRGLTKRYDEHETGSASLLSSSALLSPGADRDDPKRVNFISIQQSAVTFARGYRAMPLRTGYEQIVAHRTDDLFATTAKKPGTVTQVTPRAITVTHDDGSKIAIELGRRFGVGAGAVYPHTVVTPHKVGDVLAAGDIVAYNTNYFELDPLNPRLALWKAGVMVKTAIMETTDTLEDSSAISAKVAREMETDLTSVRNIVVSFDQVLHGLVTPGMDVEVESILCTIEDAVTAHSQLFDEDSLDTLRLLAANTPRAKSIGKVEKIEVLYHGDLDDMSESLQTLAMESDRNRKREARELGVPYTTGQVDATLRIENQSLTMDTAVIRVYITGVVPAGVGDKGVFANQMKTIFGRVMSGRNETESGLTIDAIFGYQSISNRIVQSPEVIGTTNVLLSLITKRVVDVYRGNLK